MPSKTPQRASADADSDRVIQLVYLCAVHSAVNESCKALNDIAYTSGDPANDRHLNRFQIFLCKLAQICDTKKGGDTITALVALKGDNGPEYLFASNNRRESELNDTKKFLTDLLEYVGENPVGLGEKGMSKQILWRALEFGLPKVEYYIKRVAALTNECIEFCAKYGGSGRADVLLQLQQIEARSKFPFSMLDGENSKNKFLSDCETLIKAIQVARESGFTMTIEEHAHHDNIQISRAWCELRHYLGRLHSYRQAADCIYRASRDWPDMFKGFTVRFVPSGRLPKLSLPRTPPESAQIIQTAFPDLDLEKYSDHIEALGEHGLDKNIQKEMPKKSIKRVVHCEVLLHDFLARNDTVEAHQYWDSSMFIATSKPPCRLCHYYFNDGDNDFQVQGSHMNVYPKWRLPDLCEGDDSDAAEIQEELLDDIIESMQQDTLRIIEQKIPQGKRNDSRTESRIMESAMSSRMGAGHPHAPGRNSGRFSANSRGYGRPMGDEPNSKTSSTEDFDDEEYDSTGVAISCERPDRGWTVEG